MNAYEKEERNYHRLNSVARPNGVVLFGSNFAKDIPVCELKQAFGLECNVYNRSYSDLSLYDAPALLNECLTELSPKKILIDLGETDLENGEDIPEIVAAYEHLIENIRIYSKRCKIVIISVCADNCGSRACTAGELNTALEKMADRLKCSFADISPAAKSEQPTVKAFSMLRFFMLDRISLSDVMSC
ncbi:MAG: hypothetical protein NC078_01295 [Ruminococcus sp.]|nr:hypothetical protein [Ruminococcus sp.]